MRRGKNLLKRVLYFVAILGVLMVVSYACGCAPDVDAPDADTGDADVAEDEFQTISGIYETHVFETEDTCDEDEEHRIDGMYWLIVNVQEYRDDGSYLANVSLSDLAWYDAEVASDGAVDAEENVYGIWTNSLVGLLTPDEIVATVTVTTMDWNGEPMCHVVYELEGYPLFERDGPPDRSALTNERYEAPLLPSIPDWAVGLVW